MTNPEPCDSPTIAGLSGMVHRRVLDRAKSGRHTWCAPRGWFATDCDQCRRRGCACVIRRDRRARTASLEDGPMTVSPGIHPRTPNPVLRRLPLPWSPSSHNTRAVTSPMTGGYTDARIHRLSAARPGVSERYAPSIRSPLAHAERSSRSGSMRRDLSRPDRDLNRSRPAGRGLGPLSPLPTVT